MRRIKTSIECVYYDLQSAYSGLPSSQHICSYPEVDPSSSEERDRLYSQGFEGLSFVQRIQFHDPSGRLTRTRVLRTNGDETIREEGSYEYDDRFLPSAISGSLKREGWIRFRNGDHATLDLFLGEQDPVGQRWSVEYKHDASGRLLEKSLFRGMTKTVLILCEYDERGRKTKELTDTENNTWQYVDREDHVEVKRFTSGALGSVSKLDFAGNKVWEQFYNSYGKPLDNIHCKFDECQRMIQRIIERVQDGTDPENESKGRFIELWKRDIEGRITMYSHCYDNGRVLVGTKEYHSFDLDGNRVESLYILRDRSIRIHRWSYEFYE